MRACYRWCSKNCHVIHFNKVEGILCSFGHTAVAHRVLRRSRLPRVTWSQGAPRDATIHSFHNARAARASRAGRTAGRGALPFRRQQQGWGWVSVLVRARGPSYQDLS